MLSEAAAVIVIVERLGAVVVLAGFVMATVGGVLSTVTETTKDVPALFAAS